MSSIAASLALAAEHGTIVIQRENRHRASKRLLNGCGLYPMLYIVVKNNLIPLY